MKDIYEAITNNIINQMENGIIPWRKTWGGVRGGAISHATGKPYSLLNQMLLSREGEYLTYNQAQNEGGHVKKGAKAETVVFWKILSYNIKDENDNVITDDDGNEIVKQIPVLKYYQVFHIEDCEGVEPKWNDGVKHTESEGDIKLADDILWAYINREKTLALEEVKQDKAYYSPSLDQIVLPLKEQFENDNEFYATAFHESVHSTGHKSRLDRFSEENKMVAFGDENYSKEELVAEIGSAFLCKEANIDTKSTMKNSTAYVQGWLKVLKNDKKFIVSGASKAEKAVKYILGIE